MFPTGVAGIVVFAFFVAPGLALELLRGRRRPDPLESVFRQASRIILISVGLAVLSVGVLAGVGYVGGFSLLDVGALIGPDGQKYLGGHYDVVFRAAILELGLAMLIAVTIHLLISRVLLERGPVRDVNGWTRAMRESGMPDGAAYVRIRVKGGRSYLGRVLAYKVSMAMENREVVLGPPLFVKKDDAPMTPVDPSYRAIVIPGSEVESFSVLDFAPTHPAGDPALPASLVSPAQP